MRAILRSFAVLGLAVALPALAAPAHQHAAAGNPYTYVSHPVSTDVASAQEAFARGLTRVFDPAALDVAHVFDKMSRSADASILTIASRVPAAREALAFTDEWQHSDATLTVDGL